MKWYNQLLMVLYGVSAAYFLYLTAMGIFVYIANKSMGHQESFLIPGRNLIVGLILLVFTFGAWKVFKNPDTSKLAGFIMYLPLLAVFLFFLYFLIVMISSGGKWN